MQTALQWGERIPIGVIYQHERAVFGDQFICPTPPGEGGASQRADVLQQIVDSYF